MSILAIPIFKDFLSAKHTLAGLMYQLLNMTQVTIKWYTEMD